MTPLSFATVAAGQMTQGVCDRWPSIQATGHLDEIKVIHHSSKPQHPLCRDALSRGPSHSEPDCGSLFYSDAFAHDTVAAFSSASSSTQTFREGSVAYVDTIPFLAFRRTSMETSDNDIVIESIREYARYVRQHPLIRPTTRVTGGFYNLATGLVEDVEY